MRGSRVLLAGALIAATAAPGCKILSASLELPSDISAGSSRSIVGSLDAMSKSSGASAGHDTPNKASYERDLREFTAAFTRTAGTRDDFLRGISRIAEDHGISHWEADPATPLAIGEGLHDAGWTEPQMAEFVDQAGGAPAAELALEGYRRGLHTMMDPRRLPP